MVNKKMMTAVVGIIRNSDQQLLVAKRRFDQSHAGCWEFPGGKVEPSEAPEHALVRELKEELDIDVYRMEPLMVFIQSYPEYDVQLDVHLVHEYNGVLRGAEGQSVEWVDVEALRDRKILDGMIPILDKLAL